MMMMAMGTAISVPNHDLCFWLVGCIDGELVGCNDAELVDFEDAELVDFEDAELVDFEDADIVDAEVELPPTNISIVEKG
jgi:hypothetical protein